jgi:hypothetical protein
MTRKDYAHEVRWYWPDTARAVELFMRVDTQWRVGMNGAVGLDYCAIYPLMDRMGLSAREWDDLLRDLQVMEYEALDAMHEKQD